MTTKKYCGECGSKLTTRTLINLVLDESGSMHPVKDDTIGAFNEYFDTLRKDVGDQECQVWVTKFNMGVSVLWEDVPLNKLKKLTKDNYAPNNGTALYDAIGKSLKSIAKVAKTNDRIITIIMTDGYENSSFKFTKKQIAQEINKLTEKGNYTFVYLGADIDAMAEGGGISISAGNTYTTPHTGAGMYAGASVTATASSNLMRSANLATQDFYALPAEPDKEEDSV